MMTAVEQLAMQIRDGQDPSGEKMLALMKAVEGISFLTAKPFLRAGFIDSEELPSIAFLAASEGVRKWDPDEGMSFASYYKMCLLTEILRGSGAAVHVPYGVRSRIRQYRQFIQQYQAVHGGREPDDDCICRSLRITDKDLQAVKQASMAMTPDSLDRPLMDGDDEIGTLVDVVPAAADEAEEVETRLFRQQLAEAFSEALESLPEAERTTILLLYTESLTQAQAALRMQIPVTEVRRRQRHALQRLRDERRGLAGFLSEISATRHTGLNAFKTSGASQPERMILQFEADSRPWRDRANDLPQPLHCKPCQSGEAQR